MIFSVENHLWNEIILTNYFYGNTVQLCPSFFIENFIQPLAQSRQILKKCISIFFQK